jgi:hypothetical protein
MKGIMQLTKKAPALAFSLVTALTVTACAETAVQDLLGTGKDSVPDASQVRVSQNLAMPPDLQLRAPPNGPADDSQAAAVQQPVEPVQPVAAATEPQSVSQPLKETRTASTAPLGGTASAEPPKQDVYERYGISKNYPDGKPKPERVLFEELHKAQLAEKRRANPNYGTIWNMGNIWNDQ